MVVPSGGLFDFIGKPGDIVWRAPQEQIDNWRPVWAGIGAFDTAHEVAQPEGILLDEVKLSIANSSAGAVEVVAHHRHELPESRALFRPLARAALPPGWLPRPLELDLLESGRLPARHGCLLHVHLVPESR